jgi:hypothetical protein
MLPVESSSFQLGELDPNNTSSLRFVLVRVVEYALPPGSSSVGAQGAGSGPEDYVKLQKAKTYFQENKADIHEKYLGNFIAILDNSVVDHDKEFSNLATRVYEKFGYQTVYMPFVGSEERILRIPSPRIGKPRGNALRKEI